MVLLSHKERGIKESSEDRRIRRSTKLWTGLGEPQFVSFTEKSGIQSLRWMRPILDENGNWIAWVMP